jgi:cytochrome c biogenesis protein CcmG, thiol:disulfide interchange protein DsbE
MKNQFLKLPIIIFFVILFTFFYLLVIDRNPSEIPSVLIDKKIPEFKTQSLLKNKEFISRYEFENQTVLVNFFATWCKPCRDEHDFIKKIADQKKVKVIGVNYKDDPEKAIEWLKKLGNPYAIVALDRKGKIAIDWGVYGIPETFVVNSNGIIKYRHVGPVTEKIYKKINLIIKEN